MFYKDTLESLKEKILKVVEISHEDFIYGFDKPEIKNPLNIRPMAVYPWGQYPTENYCIDGITFVIQNLGWSYSVVFFPSYMDIEYLEGNLDESWGWEIHYNRSNGIIEALIEAFYELSAM